MELEYELSKMKKRPNPFVKQLKKEITIRTQETRFFQKTGFLKYPKTKFGVREVGSLISGS